METRLNRWNAFALSLLLFAHFGYVSACGSLEAMHGAPGSQHICLNDLLNFSAASPDLELFKEREPIFEATSDEIPEISTSKAASPNYEVRSSPGKGLGVFATRLITAGSPILIEPPLISVAMPEMVEGQGFRITDMVSDLEAEYERLSVADQKEFLQLHDHRFPSEDENNQSHLLTILRSNAYNTGADRIGLFPKTARINHSCRPNAGNWWSEKTEERVIYAMGDIDEGVEITVSYIPLLKARKERQARLAQYGFVCDCVACTEDPGEGDKRRVKIGEWLDDLESKMRRKSGKEEVNKKRVEKARKLVDMVEAEKLSDYIARAYHLVAVYCEHTGNFEEARFWAGKEQKVLEWAEIDSNEALASAEFVESLKAR